jgi:large subunit ribosomal protein L20
MPRVKKAVVASRKRAKILKKTKGFRWGRKNKERAAKEALLHGLRRKLRGRKEKKRTYRTLWNVRIGALAREEGMSYSVFIAALKKKGILLDRKILADLAQNEPDVFRKIVAAVK